MSQPVPSQPAPTPAKRRNNEVGGLGASITMLVALAIVGGSAFGASTLLGLALTVRLFATAGAILIGCLLITGLYWAATKRNPGLARPTAGLILGLLAVAGLAALALL